MGMVTTKLVRLALFVVELCLIGISPAAADFAAGERAFREQDYPTALRELEPAARAGDPRAQYLLGQMYAYGGNYGHPAFARDDAKAIYWLDLSVLQNYPPAMNARAAVYLRTIRGLSEYESAMALLIRAAQMGHVRSQYDLGFIFAFTPYEDYGGKREPARAVYWFTQAAQAGAEAAYRKLSIITCSRAENTKRKDDFIVCFTWLILAIQTGGPGEIEAPKDYERLRRRVSSDDIAEATRRADDWIARYPLRDIPPD